MSRYPFHPASPLVQELAEDSPAPGSDRALALAAVERLSGLVDQLRQTLADRLWQEIPAIVQEAAYAPSTTDGYVLTALPNVSELVKITTVIVSVPAGATGTLRLGTDHVIPNLPAGPSSFLLTKLMGATDTRSLTITGGAGGPAALILHGMQTAPTGNIAP